MTTLNNTRDVTAQQRFSGTGLQTLFLCARCSKRKDAPGRRLQPVQGVRQWVCKGCAK